MSAGAAAGFLVDPMLEATGVRHGFGLRGACAPDPHRRAVQVHGSHVAWVERECAAPPGEADVVGTKLPGMAVAVVTADCVPVLLADVEAGVVAAVHAGWRGLAAGVVERGVGAMCERGADPARVCAAVGPHIGSCCYEVDGPVIDALRARFGEGTEEALSPTRPGHAQLELGRMVAEDLGSAGLAPERIGRTVSLCTRCDAQRFDSFRRDGPRAGRMIHWIALPECDARQG